MNFSNRQPAVSPVRIARKFPRRGSHDRRESLANGKSVVGCVLEALIEPVS